MWSRKAKRSRAKSRSISILPRKKSKSWLSGNRRGLLEPLEQRTLLSFSFVYTNANSAAVNESGGSDSFTVINNGAGLLEWSTDHGATFSTQWGAVPADTLSANAATVLTINQAGNSSNVIVGMPTAASSAASNVLAHLQVNPNPGTNGSTLTVDDTKSALSAGTYTLSASGSNTSIAGPLNDVNITTTLGFTGGATLLGNNANNVFNVTSSYAFQPTTITGGAGDDTFNVGSAGNSLGAILGAITVHGQGQTTGDKLNVNDQGDLGGPYTYTLTSTTIARTGTATITYDTTEAVVVNGNNSGNTFNVNSTAGSIATTVNGGSGSDGFAVTAGALGGSSTNQINGQGGNDTFTVTGALAGGAALNIDGGAPTLPSSPGDTLNVPSGSTVAPSGPGAGSVTGVVSAYTSIETVGGGPYTLNVATANFGVANNGVADTVNLVRSGANLDLYVDTVLEGQFAYASVGAISVTGSQDNDSLTIDNSGGLIQRTITYSADNTGPANGNSLHFIGNPGAAVARETYLVGATKDAGTWVLDPNDHYGAGASGASAQGAGQFVEVVNFTGISPADSSTPAAIYDIIMNAAANQATVENGGLLNGFTSLQLTDNNATFETTRWANKALVRIMGQDGADAFRVNYTTASAGLNELQIYGYLASGVVGQPADNGAAKVVELDQTAGPITTVSMVGSGGADLVHNLFFGPFFSGAFDLSNVTGTVNIDGQTAGPGTTTISLEEHNNTTSARTVLLTNNRMTGAGPATINYANIATFDYGGSTLGDTINVTSTQLGTNYILDGNGGSDTLTIGNTLANFSAPTAGFANGGSLAAIQGPITWLSDDGFGTAGAANTLNVDASHDVGLAATPAVIDTVANETSTIYGQTITGAATTLTGFAPASISYYHATVAGSFGLTGPNALQFLNVRGSEGADVINVNATTATTATTIQGLGGNDTFNITADNLSAANDFQGDDNGNLSTPGTDTFNLNITNDIGASAVYPPTSGLTIEGDKQAADGVHRDKLTINDFDGNFVARNLNFHYLSQTSGDMDITGFAQTIQARTMETVVSHNIPVWDDVTVTGTPGDDEITVAPLSATSAAVFIGTEAKGGGWENDPGGSGFFQTLPGVAGGSTGPDLYVTDIDPNTSSSFAVRGGGAVNGDQLYVERAE